MLVLRREYDTCDVMGKFQRYLLKAQTVNNLSNIF